MHVALLGQLKILQRLVETSTVDISPKNVKGQTPLALAVLKCDIEIHNKCALFLVDKGALHCEGAGGGDMGGLLLHAACRAEVINTYLYLVLYK